MKRLALCAVLVLAALHTVAASQKLLLIGVGGATSVAVSNITLVNSTACFSNSGTSYSCTIPSTAAGDGLIIIQEDADNPSAPTVPTGVTGSTCVTDHSYAQSNNEGRQTYFNCPNISAGTTTVTLHVASSGHSAVNVREYSGLATSSLLDTIVAAKTVTTSTTTEFSNPLATSQTDLAVTSCSEGATATSNMAAGTGWGNGKKFVQTADATDSYAADMLNVQGQITGILTGDSHNYTCILALYKSAVAGTPPTGNTPTAYSDFENSTNGTALTSAILIAGTHGGSCTWTGTSSGMTVSTSGEQATVQNVTTNGVTYTAPDAGTRGIAFDATVGGNATCTWVGGNATTASAGVWWKAPASQDATSPDSFITIGGNGAADYADAQLLQVSGGTRRVILEAPSCGACASSFITLPTLATWYMVTVQYVGGGTHSLSIYDTSGSQVGSTLTAAATGTNRPVSIQFGNSHGTAGTTGSNPYYFDNLLMDYVNGTFPLKQ